MGCQTRIDGVQSVGRLAHRRAVRIACQDRKLTVRAPVDDSYRVLECAGLHPSKHGRRQIELASQRLALKRRGGPLGCGLDPASAAGLASALLQPPVCTASAICAAATAAVPARSAIGAAYQRIVGRCSWTARMCASSRSRPAWRGTARGTSASRARRRGEPTLQRRARPALQAGDCRATMWGHSMGSGLASCLEASSLKSSPPADTAPPLQSGRKLSSRRPQGPRWSAPLSTRDDIRARTARDG